VWKEWNIHIFNISQFPNQKLQSIIYGQIQESIHSLHRELDSLNSPLGEKLILARWNFAPSSAPPSMRHTPQVQSPSTWYPPTYVPLKLNFDGAAKGNPIPVEIGGVFRDKECVAIHIFLEFVGTSSNNVTDLSALIMGLTIALRQGWNSLIVEGNSVIIIQTTQRLLCGSGI